MLRHFPALARAAMLASLISFAATVHAQTGGAPPANRGDIEGAVTDSSTGQPLPTIEIVIQSHAHFIAGTYTDAFGRYTVHNLRPDTYTVSARLIGFRPQSQTVSITATTSGTANFRLVPTPVQMGKVEVTAQAPTGVDVRSGDQTFQADQYHGAPTTTTSQILQQSIAGAVRAPTGEVHIRGQHAEYTYYVDGVPVPSGVSGSLNELFDPSIINHIDFKTGGWDAEFGNKNAAIVDLATRIPSGGYHFTLGGYGGSFNANGQSFTASAAGNKFGAFFSGARQETDMRTEPVMADPATTEAINFHNYGKDLSGFGKLQWIPRTSDIVALDGDWSETHFEVPYDSTGGVVLDDRQKDANGFLNLSWRHRFGVGDTSGTNRELFAAVLYRKGSLEYTPGPNDDPQFIFFPDPTPYNLSEDRSFHTVGGKIDFTDRMSHALELKAGTLVSSTGGHEAFVTTDVDGNPGPASISDLTGWDASGYVQAAISPTDQLEIRPGVRYDAHHAPFAGTATQVSPRLRLSYFPDAGNTVWAYYGRLFIPTNIEDLRAVTSVADSGVATQPTVPERDDFYEAGYVHRFPVGVVAKLTGYYKRSSPGIDDNTVPGSAIVTSVNIDQVRITGIETAIEVQPAGPWSGYLNLALNHAWGHGPITGGFFPADTPEGDFDLDHDQRLSGVASITYALRQLWVNTSGIYGSGLTNGEDPDASYGTGLLDFNRSIHVPASFILNASAGYSIPAGNVVVRPQVYVDNIFDKHYLLKGAFFSGASVGRPRSVQGKIDVSF